MPQGMTKQQFQTMREFGFRADEITPALLASQLGAYTGAQQVSGKGAGPSELVDGPRQRSYVLVHRLSADAANYKQARMVAEQCNWDYIVQVPGKGLTYCMIALHDAAHLWLLEGLCMRFTLSLHDVCSAYCSFYA